MTKEKSLYRQEHISLECIMAVLYFVCLPFTIVTTPFGSLLKVVTIPIIAVLAVRMFMGKSELSFNYIHFLYALYILYSISMLFLRADDMAIVTTKDMVLGILMLLLISMRVYNKREIEFIETAWIIMGIYCIIVGLSSKEVVSEYESRAVKTVLPHLCGHRCGIVLCDSENRLKRRSYRRLCRSDGIHCHRHKKYKYKNNCHSAVCSCGDCLCYRCHTDTSRGRCNAFFA